MARGYAEFSPQSQEGVGFTAFCVWAAGGRRVDSRQLTVPHPSLVFWKFVQGKDLEEGVCEICEGKGFSRAVD
jgi:hypothetical protein